MIFLFFLFCFLLLCCQGFRLKRSHLCEQEQLASELHRALSLSQLGSLAASRKLATTSKSKGKPGEFQLKEHGVHSSTKGGTHKLAARLSSQSVQKVKGQKRSTLFSCVRSELSSCSNSEYLEILSDTCGLELMPSCTFIPTGKRFCVFLLLECLFQAVAMTHI